MITNKERFRRFTVRLKTLFNIPDYDTYEVKGGKTERWKKFYLKNIPVEIPNYWYTPFEVYVLAHIQRAHFIMTCNEWDYVDASLETYVKYILPSEEYCKDIAEWQTKQMEERIRQFVERVKNKDENSNTQTESDN